MSTTTVKKVTTPVVKDLQTLKETAVSAGYAALGAGDLAREQAQVTVTKAQAAAQEAQDKVTALPSQAVERGLAAAGQMTRTFDQLSSRGRTVAKKLRKVEVELPTPLAEAVVLPAPAKPAPAKRATAKSAAAKKAPARKTTAQKKATQKATASR